MDVYIYSKLPNFIQLPLTWTKLCHIKRDHLVNHLRWIFTFHSDNTNHCDICLQLYDRSPQNLARWCTACLSSAPAVTNLTLTSRMRAADMPQRSVLLHQQISRLMAAVRHLVFLKLKFLTATHIRDMFCTNVSTFVEICHCCRDVAIFRVFSVKCKNALDDRA